MPFACSHIHMGTHTHTHIPHYSHLWSLVVAHHLHGLGSKWAQRKSMRRKREFGPSSDFLCDLLNLPLFQQEQSSLAFWESFDSTASGSVTGTWSKSKELDRYKEKDKSQKWEDKRPWHEGRVAERERDTAKEVWRRDGWTMDAMDVEENRKEMTVGMKCRLDNQVEW